MPTDIFDSSDKSEQLDSTVVGAGDIYIMHDCMKLCFRITCDCVGGKKAAACLGRGNLEKGGFNARPG